MITHTRRWCLDDAGNEIAGRSSGATDDSCARVFPLDGRPHRAERRTYMGDSRAHWDGNTLVVDTTNFNGTTGVGANGRAVYTASAAPGRS